MKPTTSIRSASNVASLCVFLYRDRKTKKGPTRILPSKGKRLWRYTRTCVTANRNACRQEFYKAFTIDRIKGLLHIGQGICHRAMELSIQTATNHTWIIQSRNMDILGVVPLVKTLVLFAQLSSCTSHFQQDVAARNAQVKVDKYFAERNLDFRRISVTTKNHRKTTHLVPGGREQTYPNQTCQREETPCAPLQ